MSVQRLAAFVSTAIVVAAIAAALFVTGSPSEQRLLRLDTERVNDLQQLSLAANFRWDQDRRLPESGGELVDGRYLSRLPVDPVTGEDYEYRTSGPRRFEVCATFDRPASPELAGDFWFHEAGRQCFSFDVAENSGRER
jgi:hypothetical protein